MNQFTMVAACGVWSALPLTGNWLFIRCNPTFRFSPLPLITSFSLMTVAGIAVWSPPMLMAAIAGMYRAEYFGLLGWVITLFTLIGLFKKQQRLQFINFKPSRWDWILAVGLVLAAGLYLGFPTESILGGRDQGVYANHGIYIAQHGRLDIPYPYSWMLDDLLKQAVYIPPVPRSLPQFLFPGFFLTKPTMTVQFAHLFPVWLAQAFSTFGYRGLFCLNCVFALLFAGIFYGMCRFVTPKPYAVTATLFLALNVSQVWLARITLTEVLTQFFIWSGLLLLLQALREENKVLAQWAGIFLGISALVRVDSLLLIPLIFLSHLVLKIANKSDASVCSSIWPALYQSALPTFAFGVCYYAFYSTPYFYFVLPQLTKTCLFGLVALLSLLAATPNILGLIRPWLVHSITLGLINLALLGLAAYAYWIRPNAMPYSIINWPGYSLDSTRDYRENSLVNLAQYLSPLMIWAGILGWLVALRTLVWKNQNRYLVPVLVVSMGFSVLYTWNPSVDPDHFWAIRRFVPVVIPGFVFFATLGTRWLQRRGEGRGTSEREEEKNLDP